MSLIVLLIVLPLLSALVLVAVGSEKNYSTLVSAMALAVICVSLLFAFSFYNGKLIDVESNELSGYVVAIFEVLVAGIIINCCVKSKRYPIALMGVIQLALMLFFEFKYGHDITKARIFFVDQLSIIMVLIIGIIGSLIVIFATKYMKDYHNHHSEVRDRRKFFFAIIFIFISSMFGLVITNVFNLMLLFWEITSLCSFLLIGYSETEEAKNNSFLALSINVFGGLLFTAGIIIIGVKHNIGDFITLYLLNVSNSKFLYAGVFLMAVAGLTKSAQLPFSKWLLGAMVAPTPVSALLHSSTMVKAGVFLIIKLSPILLGSLAGQMITMIGALTFFVASCIAVSQSDGKKILAYSTIANLGLIVACSSLGTPEAKWAAIMLIIFHALAKSLLFLTVGATEHQIDSRNVERMDGLLNLSPTLALLLSIGIVGMFVAPFGMLISKWAAISAFISNNNVIILTIIAFGSTITFFFWTKWLGKIIADAKVIKQNNYELGLSEKIGLYPLGGLVVIVCACFTLLSKYLVLPYVTLGFIKTSQLFFMSRADSIVILLMIIIILSMACVLIPIYKIGKDSQGPIYMAGENTGDNSSYYGSMGEVVKVEMKNWYMESIFGEKLWLNRSILVCSVILIQDFFILAGGF